MTEHNLFQEVQEDLERQRLEALWKRYGAWVVAGALVLVLATGGETAYHSWKIARDQHVTSALLAATKGAEPGKTVELLQKFAQENPNNAQADFALLRAGGLAADQNDRAKAVQLFDQVAGDAQADTALRQLGDLLSVQAQMDVGDPAALSLRLQPLTEAHAPWRFSAVEAQAYLALRAGDKAQAKRLFTDLSQDADAPQSLSARAVDMLRSFD